MIQVLLILIGFAALVALVKLRSSYGYGVDTATPVEIDDLWDHVEHPYHCVACKCLKNDCTAVATMKNKVYLVGEEHRFPLPACTAVRCRCKYEHYPDRRRDEEDRRVGFGMEQDMYKYTHNRDRRVSLGRRIEDWSVA